MKDRMKRLIESFIIKILMLPWFENIRKRIAISFINDLKIHHFAQAHNISSDKQIRVNHMTDAKYCEQFLLKIQLNDAEKDLIKAKDYGNK